MIDAAMITGFVQHIALVNWVEVSTVGLGPTVTGMLLMLLELPLQN